MKIKVKDIKQLIIQNKESLLHEIRNSKELVSLLQKSSYKKLTTEEKEKMRVLLINVCRSIPAFAIFMLPGGMVLLPLFAQLIPEILPESFRKSKKSNA